MARYMEYFGLKGTPSPAGGSDPQVSEYLQKYRDQWNEIESSHALQNGRVGNDREVALFPDYVMAMDFDRQPGIATTEGEGGTPESPRGG